MNLTKSARLHKLPIRGDHASGQDIIKMVWRARFTGRLTRFSYHTRCYRFCGARRSRGDITVAYVAIRGASHALWFPLVAFYSADTIVALDQYLVFGSMYNIGKGFVARCCRRQCNRLARADKPADRPKLGGNSPASHTSRLDLGRPSFPSRDN